MVFKRAARAPALLGGEWAGWCCTFDAQTGALKQIPEKFCSETAIAWGQIPCGFEELQTEAFSQIQYMDGSERTTTDVPVGDDPEEPMRRRRVQVHPTVGCGGDSLPGVVTRSLLASPRSGALELRAKAAATPEALRTNAWAIDERLRVQSRTGTWRLETVLRGIGGALPASTVNAFPSLRERTRVSVLYDPSNGQLVAEAPHPSTPHLTPPPSVEVWQERCWSEEVALEVMEKSHGPLHFDAVDKSRRVGMGCFGEVRAAVGWSAPSHKSLSGPATSSPSSAAEGKAWRLTLLGGVELCGGPGLLEVSLQATDLESGVDGEMVVLRRVWKSADSGELADVVIITTY